MDDERSKLMYGRRRQMRKLLRVARMFQELDAAANRRPAPAPARTGSRIALSRSQQ